MEINAHKGFSPHESVFVMSENYRNVKGLTAKLVLKPLEIVYEGNKLNTGFKGSIGCTNATGAGRTCESYATVKGYAFPLECSPCIQQIREQI